MKKTLFCLLLTLCMPVCAVPASVLSALALSDEVAQPPGTDAQESVLLPEEELTEPEIAYAGTPIVPDTTVTTATITVSDNTHGSNAIEDAVLYSNRVNRNYGDYVYDRVGIPSATYGIGRTLVRLSGLIALPEYQMLLPDQILNVTFYAREATAASTQNIELYPVLDTTWEENTVTWNSFGSYTTAVNYGTTAGSGQWSAFDITDLVKAWKNGTYSEDAGFILVNRNEANDCCFCSSEYANNTAYRPYVVVTYRVGGSSFETALDLPLNYRATVYVGGSYSDRYFKFTPTVTQFYTLDSFNLAGDPYVELYNSNGDLLASDDNSKSTFECWFSYHLTAGKTYYLKATFPLVHWGSYQIEIRSGAIPAAVYGATDLSLNGTVPTVSIAVPLERKIYRIPAGNAGKYLLFSNNRSGGDPRVWVYNASGQEIAQNDDGAGGFDFRVTFSCSETDVLYIVTGQHLLNTGSYRLNPFAEAEIADTRYYIKNVVSALIAQVIVNQDMSQTICQGTFGTSHLDDWDIEKLIENGETYYIISGYDQAHYLECHTSSGNCSVDFSVNITDAVKWKIYSGFDYGLIFEPKTEPGKLLYTPNSNAGTTLQFLTMENFSNRCLWRLAGNNALNAGHVSSTSFAIRYLCEVENAQEWRSLVQAAVDYWNTYAGTNIVLTDGQSQYIIIVVADEYNDYAITHSWSSGSIITYSETEIFDAKFSGIMDCDEAKIGVIAHEIGHLLGLADNPAPEIENQSLMNRNRDHLLVQAPQPFDIYNIYYTYN